MSGFIQNAWNVAAWDLTVAFAADGGIVAAQQKISTSNLRSK